MVIHSYEFRFYSQFSDATQISLSLPFPSKEVIVFGGANSHAAAMNERGKIWSHEGVVRNSSTTRNEERITTLYKMNTKVLKLSELCWDHFLRCFSDRTCLVRRPELMQELYIPAQFAERVY